MQRLMTHNHGGEPCGKPAILWVGDESPKPYQVIESKDFRTLSGGAIEPLSQPLCGSCNGAFMLFSGDIN